jgi:hypothetical protein
MRLSVSVDVDNALHKLLPRSAQIEAALDAGAAAAHSVMQVYPPPPAGSRYRRTGNLRQKLRIKKLAKTSRIVENTASYARYVYGMPQARVHRGRWAALKDAAEAALKEALAVLKERGR